MLKKKQNRLFVVGLLVILIGVIIGIAPIFASKIKKQNEDNKIDDFLNKKENIVTDKVEVNTEDKDFSNVDDKDNELNSNTDDEEYIMILEIPKIGFRKGLYNRDSKYNNIQYNVAILKEADMPDVKNGNLVLAGHNGNANISFFNKLDRLQNGDYIYIYYDEIKYIYEMVDIYDVPKNGQVSINRDKEKSVITLITCKKNESDKQVVYIGNLVRKENY